MEKILFELDIENTEISNKVIENIYLIAKSEGMRDRAIYENYPGYNFISHEIHSGIGGELLKRGVLVPLYREKNDKFKDISTILYNLGMSLQGLDDLCDMEEDFFAKKINLATSFFVNRLEIDEETAASLDILDTPATEEYLQKIMSYSMESFNMLEEIGYPINKKLGMKLLFHLFKIRGSFDKWGILGLSQKAKRVVDLKKYGIITDEKNNYSERSKIFFDKTVDTNYGNSEKLDKYNLKNIDIDDGTTVLDLGCGDGIFLQKLRGLNLNNILYGLDISEKMLELAGSKKIKRCGFSLGDSSYLPYSDGSIDLIVCLNSFYHYSTPELTLKDLKIKIFL